MWKIILITVIFLGLGCCGSKADHSKKQCIPGESRPCACQNGLRGRQLCARDGQSLGLCKCDKPKVAHEEPSKGETKTKGASTRAEDLPPERKPPSAEDPPLKVVRTTPSWCDDWCGVYIGTADLKVWGGDGQLRRRKGVTFKLRIGFRKKEGDLYYNGGFGYQLNRPSFQLALPKDVAKYNNVTLSGNQLSIVPNASFSMKIDITKKGATPENRILTGTIIRYILKPSGEYEETSRMVFSAGFKERG